MGACNRQSIDLSSLYKLYWETSLPSSNAIKQTTDTYHAPSSLMNGQGPILRLNQGRAPLIGNLATTSRERHLNQLPVENHI